MKKFILFSILSMLFYSVPGHAMHNGDAAAARAKALEEVAERREAARAAEEESKAWQALVLEELPVEIAALAERREAAREAARAAATRAKALEEVAERREAARAAEERSAQAQAQLKQLEAQAEAADEQWEKVYNQYWEASKIHAAEQNDSSAAQLEKAKKERDETCAKRMRVYDQREDAIEEARRAREVEAWQASVLEEMPVEIAAEPVPLAAERKAAEKAAKAVRAAKSPARKIQQAKAAKGAAAASERYEQARERVLDLTNGLSQTYARKAQAQERLERAQAAEVSGSHKSAALALAESEAKREAASWEKDLRELYETRIRMGEVGPGRGERREIIITFDTFDHSENKNGPLRRSANRRASFELNVAGEASMEATDAIEAEVEKIQQAAEAAAEAEAADLGTLFATLRVPAKSAAPEATVARRQAAVAEIEAALARRQAAVAEIEAALAETQEATVARSVASQAALAEATVVRRQAAEATGAPATEEAPSIASLERLKECVGSLERTVLVHAQGVSTVLQEREYALNEHLLRLNAMTQAIFNRNRWRPSRMMSREEQAKDEGLRRSADIIYHAFSIEEDQNCQRDANLAGLARNKELVSTIIQKAAGLRSAEVSREAVWQAAVLEPPPVEVVEAVPRELDAAERAEAQRVGALQALCWIIRNKVPCVQPQALVDLAKETLSEMGNILSEMDLELMAMWKGEIAYYKEVGVLSAILRSTVEGNPELVTVEGDYVAASRCYEALLEQAVAEGSYTPAGTSFDDPRALLERCTALMLDINIFDEKTVQASSEYIEFSQEYLDALMERGGSVVEAYLGPLVESEEGAEGPETPTVQAAPSPEDPEDHAD